MIWDADPVLLRLGPLEIRYYSLMFVIGFVVMGQYVARLFKQHGRDPELVSSLTTYIIVGMLLGSRLAHCLFYEPDYYLSRPLEILKVWEGGLASHGGYAGVLIAVWAFLRKHRDLNFFWVLDLIVGPCLFVGGLIRIGNFFNSEIVGGPTSLPWAIVFEKIDKIPRHPAQLYEAIGYFAIAGFLMWVAHRKFNTWPRGTNLALAIILSFTFRFFVEFVKDEQSVVVLTDAINMGQWLSLGFVVVGFVYLRLINQRKT